MRSNVVVDSIKEIPVEKKTFMAFGDDFEPPDVPSEQNFCMNGFVSANRIPHPSLITEVKKEYQNIWVKKDRNQYFVRNEIII